MVYFIFSWYFMVLYGTSWDFFSNLHWIHVSTPLLLRKSLWMLIPCTAKALGNIPKTSKNWQSRLANLIFQKSCRFSRALERALRMFSTHASFISAFTSLASVFPRIHRISVQPSQETLKDHHAVCKIYHLMLLMDKILQANWQLILTDIGEAPMNHSHPKWFTPDFPASSVSSKFAAECLVTNQSLQLQLRPQVAMKLQLQLRLLKKLVHRASVARRFAVSSLSAGFFPKVWRC